MFLGTKLSDDMSWNEHIETVCGKLNSYYFGIRTLKQNLTKKSLMVYYYSSVYATVSYNILGWGGASQTHRVFKAQKRIIRLIFSLNYNESCRETFVNKKILTLSSIYIMKLLLHIKKNVNNYKKHSNVHSHNTRHSEDLCLPKFRKSYYKKSPEYMGIYLYNKLPARLKSVQSPKQFKCQLKACLLENCFYSLEEFENYLNKKNK